jgi:hypothetical protein
MTTCLAEWARAAASGPRASVSATDRDSLSIPQVRESEQDDSEIPGRTVVSIPQSLKQLSPKPGEDEKIRGGRSSVSATSPVAAAVRQLELLAS